MMKYSHFKFITIAMLILIYSSTQLSYGQYQCGLMGNIGLGQFAGNSKINKVPVAVGSGQVLLNRPITQSLAIITGLGYGTYGTKYRTKWSGAANGIVDAKYHQQTLFYPIGVKYILNEQQKWFVQAAALCHLVIKSDVSQNGNITDFENKKYAIDFKMKNYKNMQPAYGSLQIGIGKELIINDFTSGWAGISFEQGLSRVNKENDFYKEYQQAVQLHLGILFSSHSLK